LLAQLLIIELMREITWSIPEPIQDGYHESGILSQPYTSVSYYYLDAVTPEALKQQLRERGPTDFLGHRRDASTFWKVKWRWSAGSKGTKTDWSTLRCLYAVVVTLPRWVPVQPLDSTVQSRALQQEWRRFTKAIGMHEREHVAMIAKDHQQVCDAIRKAVAEDPTIDLVKADNIAERALEKLRKSDREFDIATDNGRTQGARFAGG